MSKCDSGRYKHKKRDAEHPSSRTANHPEVVILSIINKVRSGSLKGVAGMDECDSSFGVDCYCLMASSLWKKQRISDERRVVREETDSKPSCEAFDTQTINQKRSFYFESYINYM